MPYNLLQQSNDFDTTWSANIGANVTSGQSGYDGTNNAWLLSTTQSGSQLVQSKSLSGVHTLSVYAKAGTYDFCRVLILSANTAFTDFNLANGTIGTSDPDTIDATITSVGSGWYRLTLTASDSAITAVRLYAIVADNNILGTSGNIYIQNAQLVKGTSAKTYFPTTTRLNMPRVDYLNNSNGSLILEPQRSNLLTYSEDFTEWATNANITPNSAISPDGTQNATLFSHSGGSFPQVALTGITFVSGADYTPSLYVKSDGTNQVQHSLLVNNVVVNFTPTDEN